MALHFNSCLDNVPNPLAPLYFHPLPLSGKAPLLVEPSDVFSSGFYSDGQEVLEEAAQPGNSYHSLFVATNPSIA